MFRAGKWAAAVALATVSVWAGVALVAQERNAPPANTKTADVSALREAVAAAAKRGENVDEIRKALDAFEKALPTIQAGRVPAELQALRDAVDAAARKGENVDAVVKELVAVETALTGRSLAKPKPEPQPELPPNGFVPPRNFVPPRGNPPAAIAPIPFPNFQAPAPLDAEAFKRATDLRLKALDLLVKNPGSPEAGKMLAEADQLMLKALLADGGRAMPAFPDFAFPEPRAPERARLGIRLEKVSAITAEQLGLDADVGIAVMGVVPGSVAERAGLKVHDIVIEFAGKPVSGAAEDFIRTVNATKAGEKVDLVVLRKGKKVDVKGVVLADAGAPPAPQRGRVIEVPPVPEPAVPKPATTPPLPAPPPLPGPVRDQDISAPTTAVRAENPPKAAKPDLADLRDAVTAANKRGENVDAVRDALAALEKALDKGAVKADEAPAELVALREAVEGAMKKGENVDAIAKELALVERAVTGRAYERPAPQEQKLEPAQPFPRRPGGFAPPNAGGFGRPGFGGGRMAPPDGFNAASVTVVNDKFTIAARKQDGAYHISGTIGEKGPEIARVFITDGDKKIEAESLEKVPAEYKPTVERLLKMANRG